MSGARCLEALDPRALHPSHLAAKLPMLNAGVVARLTDCPRLSDRIVALLAMELPPLPQTEPDASQSLAMRPTDTVAEAGRMMGALWHGRAIAQCIGAEATAQLDASIGRSARLFALRASAAAGIPSLAAPPPGTPLAALVEAVNDDGWRCLARWRDTLAEPYRQLATLKLPADGLPTAHPGQQADPIIARVAQELTDAR